MNFNKILLIFTLSFLISCENSKNQDNQLPENGLSISKEQGIFPKDHIIYNAVGYDDLMATYHTAKKEEQEKHYYHNLSNYIIFKIFQTNFYRNSNNEDRAFLLNELVDLKHSTPNIDNFYSLINFMLVHEEINIKNAQNIAQKFEEKNKTEIMNSLQSKPELKEKKLNTIKKGQNDILLYERKLMLKRIAGE